jgi:hypothetical protein
VLVQFDRSGYEEISRADLVLESARAVERAMDTIKSMGWPAHPSTSRSSGTSGRTPTPGDLQQLRRFTVQILDRRLRTVCGTGAVVSREGHVATCAHVVRYAGIDPSELGGVGVSARLTRRRTGNEDRHARARS